MRLFSPSPTHTVLTSPTPIHLFAKFVLFEPAHLYLKYAN